MDNTFNKIRLFISSVHQWRRLLTLYLGSISSSLFLLFNSGSSWTEYVPCRFYRPNSQTYFNYYIYRSYICQYSSYNCNCSCTPLVNSYLPKVCSCFFHNVIMGSDVTVILIRPIWPGTMVTLWLLLFIDVCLATFWLLICLPDYFLSIAVYWSVTTFWILLSIDMSVWLLSGYCCLLICLHSYPYPNYR